MTEPLWNTKQVAVYLGVSTRTVKRHIKSGDFPDAIRLGGCFRWRPEKVREWIESGGTKKHREVN